MKLILASTLVVVAAAVAVAEQPVLVFPGETPARLRLDVASDKEPDAAWAKFLDRLFAHFDRNGNGMLSAAEAARIFPLPLPGGREAAMDFAELDADKDGKGSPAEVREFYRARGFTPVVAVVRPAPPQAHALGAALFRHLDRNGDGRLSHDELRQAPTLQRRLDEDEDEVLTAAEILGPNPPKEPARDSALKLAPAGEKASVTLRYAPGGKPKLSEPAAPFALDVTGIRLGVPGGTCEVSVSNDDPTAGFRAARKFYLAQFIAAAGEKAVAKAALEDDPATQVLAGLFDSADRDGDSKLTRAELDAFFGLVEAGLSCQTVVTATDRGRNLFDIFDANRDGRLDSLELSHGGRTLAERLTDDHSLAPADVTATYHLAVGRGPVGDSFGPVPFGSTKATTRPAAPVVLEGPAWFRARDRNGDGFVSAREFVGSPALFTKLDADGDGRISRGEAEAAAVK